MADSYINPVSAKMTDYARRMQELISEAYADGIVLSTMDPEGGFEELPAPDGHGFYRVVVGVPLMDRVNLALRQPAAVMAQAVTKKGDEGQPVEIVPPVLIPGRRKPARVIPIRRPESEWCFVDPTVVPPWLIGNSELATSALKFGAKFDILGLSYDEQLEKRGIITKADILDAAAGIEKIYYRTIDGALEVVDVTRTPFTAFVFPVQGDLYEMQVDAPIRVSLKGGPVTTEKETALLHIAGSVSRRYGVVQLNVQVDDPRIQPVGYTLLMGRLKPASS